MRLVINLVTIFILTLILAGMVSAEIVDIYWSMGPEHPTNRKAGSVGVIDDIVISAAGGEFPWAESPAVYAYTPGSEGWTKLPDVPRGSAYTNGIEVENALYVCGGRNTYEKTFKTFTDVYKLSKNSNGNWEWARMPDMITHRGFYGIGRVGTKIVAAGGNKIDDSAQMITPTTTINNVEWFDTANPSAGWKALAPIIGNPRGWSACCGVGDKLYLFGGMYVKDGYIRTNEAMVLDTKANKWSRISDMPYGLSGGHAVAYKDRYVIIVGGASPGESEKIGGTGWYKNKVLVYDTATDAYKVLPTRMPNGTHDIRSAIIGNKIYVVGGENINKETSNTTNYFRIGTIVEQ